MTVAVKMARGKKKKKKEEEEEEEEEEERGEGGRGEGGLISFVLLPSLLYIAQHSTSVSPGTLGTPPPFSHLMK